MARMLNQLHVQWLLVLVRFDFRVMYVPSGQNQRMVALSHKPKFTRNEDKILPRMVIPLEWFTTTEEPVDLRVRIREAQ